MSGKALVKNVVQAMLFSSANYRRLRRAALECNPINVSNPRVGLEKISPRPKDARAPYAPLPSEELDITVIVPIYKVEAYVGACLESILDQDIDASMEVIAVIDGSPDGSEEIVREIAGRDGRLRVIVQENQGLSAARNAGIAAAHGAWIAFVDSDDMLAPGHLAALVKRMRAGECDVVASLWRRMDEGGAIGELGEPVRTHMAPWGRLYKREVWETLRFPVGCWYEDLITPCCIQPLFNEAYVDDAGYLYRTRPGSIVEESSTNVKALDAYWALDEMLSWRYDLGCALGCEDWDRLVWIMGPLTEGRTTFLEDGQRRLLFSALCDTVASLEELSGERTTLPGVWQDIDLALRGRHYELWCLACAALAKDSSSIKMTTAWKIYRASLGMR